MCLLITQNKQSPRLANHWIENFFQSNSDGLGVMYAQNNELVIKKLLPKNASELIDFYNQYIYGKKSAWHLRMRTHGDIDLLNCHPYEVLNKNEHGIDLWLMHNGILSTGNKADPSKSDTWHYIKDYLKPMLANNPSFAFTNAFKEIIGDHIGSSNKFVLMDNKGNQATVNKSSGVFWAGLWLSNTYAWSSSHTVSKNYSKDQALAKKQAQETIIEKYQGYKYQPKYQWAYDDDLREYDPHYFDTENSIFLQVEELFDDLDYDGLIRHATREQGYDFAEHFGIDTLSDIVLMYMSNDLDQSLFDRIIIDFNYARSYGFKPLKPIDNPQKEINHES